MIKFCNKCYENHINNGMCNHGYFWCLKQDVEYCPICADKLENIIFPFEDLKILTSISNDVRLYQSMIQLYNDDIIEYELKMSQFRTQYERQASIKQMQDEEKNKPKCPKCGSTNITTGQRGYSLLTGFLGSNKTVNRCANCGYTWKP